MEEAERRLILMTLEHTRDNKTRAAEILGISLKTLHNKLNKLRGRVPGRKQEEEPVSRMTRRPGITRHRGSRRFVCVLIPDPRSRDPVHHAPRHQRQADRRRHGHRRAGGRGAVARCTSARLAEVVLHESHARGQLLANAIFHRAREVVTGSSDPYAALRADPGLRAILESSIYGESVTDAAILDTQGIIIAASDPTQVGQPLRARADLAALVERGERARPAAA